MEFDSARHQGPITPLAESSYVPAVRLLGRTLVTMPGAVHPSAPIDSPGRWCLVHQGPHHHLMAQCFSNV
jgi:hypothetical protein